MVLASAGGFPSDVNLIQVHKALHHAFKAVRSGGSIIMVAECSEGLGSSTFLPYFQAGSSRNIAERLIEDYQINGHTALALKEKCEAVDIYFISAMQDDLIERVGMIPCKNIQEAWSIIAKKHCDLWHHTPQGLGDLVINLVQLNSVTHPGVRHGWFYPHISRVCTYRTSG